jgi:hypothetical protein
MLLKENGGKSKFAEGAGRDLERLIDGGLDEQTVMAGQLSIRRARPVGVATNWGPKRHGDQLG